MAAAVIVGGTRDTADEHAADRLKFCGYDPIHQVSNQPVPDDDFFKELFDWVDANGGPSNVVAFVCEVGAGNTEVQNRLKDQHVRTCGFTDLASLLECAQQLSGSPT